MAARGSKPKRFRSLRSPDAVLAASAISSGAGGLELLGAARTGCGGFIAPEPVRPDKQPYEVDPHIYRPFDGALTSFNRARVALADTPGAYRGVIWDRMRDRCRAGDRFFSTTDLALRAAADIVAGRLTFSGSAIDYRLETRGYSFPDSGSLLPADVPAAEFSNAEEAAAVVKRVARFLGAELVGVAALDRRWVYTHVWLDDTRRRAPLELPPDYHWAVVVGSSMDYDRLTTAPSAAAFAATLMSYTRMTVLITALAVFIRNLGYRAIASGNDTAITIPMAIDAGLGEFSRSGLLVTPEFGPRVRIGKVLTNLPLEPDHPITFGVRDFCRLCGNCAKKCPASAIPEEAAPAWSGPAPATNPGVLKWYVDGDRCLEAWMEAGTACAACIASCPYNQPPAPGGVSRESGARS